MFDMEYARWLEEHHRLMCDLRAAVQEHLPETELKMFVDGGLAHFDQLMALKAIAAKSDVFHLVSGMWLTPAERCFMWLGGFRPSDLIKVCPETLISFLLPQPPFLHPSRQNPNLLRRPRLGRRRIREKWERYERESP